VLVFVVIFGGGYVFCGFSSMSFVVNGVFKYLGGDFTCAYLLSTSVVDV